MCRLTALFPLRSTYLRITGFSLRRVNVPLLQVNQCSLLFIPQSRAWCGHIFYLLASPER